MCVLGGCDHVQSSIYRHVSLLLFPITPKFTICVEPPGHYEA